jgi:hypothetical protein
MPSAPHDVYVGYDVLPVELSPTAITIANGYFTDVKKLVYPAWPPSAEAKYYEQEDATLMVWIGPTALRAEDTGSDVAEFPIRIDGIRKSPTLDSAAALRLVSLMASDVSRVMRSNPKRVNPSDPGAVNVWGYNTEEVRVEPFAHLNAQGVPIYIFEGEWIVSVLWPFPKGY